MMKNSIICILLLLSNTLNARVIDNFNFADQSVDSSTTMMVTDTVAYSAAFGGQRTITVFPPTGNFGTTAEVSFGIFAFNAGVNTLGVSEITWTSVVGIDLIESGINNAFTFDTIGVSPDMVNILLSVTDEMNITDAVGIISVADGVQHIAFSDYSGIDFTKITNITLRVEGTNPAADFALDILETTSQSVSIPLPPSLLLFSMGLILLGFKRSHLV